MKEQIRIPSKENDKLVLKVTPGHFSSDRFHVNYYIDTVSYTHLFLLFYGGIAW